MNMSDYRGLKFNRLLIKRIKRNTLGKVYFWCWCDCGNKKWIDYSNLKTGNTKSCGCMVLESRRARKQPDEEIRLSVITRYYRKNAKDRGIRWKLTRETARYVLSKPCTYCGHKGTPFIGIDRADNSQAYTEENCVPCCETCNRAKLKMTIHDFDDWIVRVYRHRKEQIWPAL